VSAAHALGAEVRLYDHLFTDADPNKVPDGKAFVDFINPDSLKVVPSCKIEPFAGQADAGARFQFLRNGYFVVDPDSTGDNLVFNRTVTLRDTWAKIKGKAKK
jgi:glutaminyl-tRNA synthetase